MKQFRLSILTILWAGTTWQTVAQGVRPKIDPSLPTAPALMNKHASEIKTTDFNGRPYQAMAPDAEGSPFFQDYFTPAVLVLNKGTVYENVSVRLDLLTQELHIVNSNGQEIIAEDGLVKQVDLLDSVSGRLTARFITGCPPIDRQNGSSFYQLLSPGRLHLLLFIKKDLEEEKDLMSGSLRQEFKERSEFYTLRDETMLRLRRDKETVLALMNDRRSDIEAWLKAHKMNWKNTKMLTELFDYYNSLLAAF